MTNSQQLVDLRERVVRALMARSIANHAVGAQSVYWQMDREHVIQIFDEELTNLHIKLAKSDRARLRDLIFAGPGGPLNIPGWWLALFDNDDEVDEIIILQHQEIFVRRKGVMEKLPHSFNDALHVQYILNLALTATNSALTAEHPTVHVPLADNAVLTAFMPPATLGTIYASIRFNREA